MSHTRTAPDLTNIDERFRLPLNEHPRLLGDTGNNASHVTDIFVTEATYTVYKSLEHCFVQTKSPTL